MSTLPFALLQLIPFKRQEFIQMPYFRQVLPKSGLKRVLRTNIGRQLLLYLVRKS